MLRIGIVAGEASGDIIASRLIAAIKKRHPDAVFEGIAGPLMIEQGCTALHDMEKLAVMGFTEVFARLREILAIRREVAEYFIQNPPDVFIGVDAPDFNLTLERKLHDAGIKAVHYVSPSVWAWRQWRVKKIARSIDLMLCLFPFEEAFYIKHGLPVKFVGHPLADEISLEPDTVKAREELGLDPSAQYLGVLPGSRMSEVRILAPLMLEAAKRIAQQQPDLKFVTPFASQRTRAFFQELLQTQYPDLPFTLVDGKSRRVMTASDLLLIASGTAALEALLAKKPMVVAYKVSFLSYLIIKSLVRLKNVSLPNILAKEDLVPELIQYDATPENMGREVLKYFDDKSNRDYVVKRYTEIHQELKRDASERAADAVLRLVGQ